MNDRQTEDKQRRVCRRWLKIVVLIAMVFGGGWLVLQYVGPYSSLRRQAVYGVGLERLQEWAISVLDNPPSMYAPIGHERRLRSEDIPSDIEQLASSCMIIYNPARHEVGVQEHILFACGGGFYHYGLRVGRPGYEPWPDSTFHFEKLGDGVWGMWER